MKYLLSGHHGPSLRFHGYRVCFPANRSLDSVDSTRFLWRCLGDGSLSEHSGGPGSEREPGPCSAVKSPKTAQRDVGRLQRRRRFYRWLRASIIHIPFHSRYIEFKKIFSTCENASARAPLSLNLTGRLSDASSSSFFILRVHRVYTRSVFSADKELDHDMCGLMIAKISFCDCFDAMILYIAWKRVNSFYFYWISRINPLNFHNVSDEFNMQLYYLHI